MLGQVTTKCIDELHSLANQQIPYSKYHRAGLLIRRFKRNKADVGPSRRFGNRLCVCRFVLLPLNERLYMDRWNEANVMAEFPDRSPPEMGARTCLHGDNAARLPRQKREQLRP